MFLLLLLFFVFILDVAIVFVHMTKEIYPLTPRSNLQFFLLFLQFS